MSASALRDRGEAEDRQESEEELRRAEARGGLLEGALALLDDLAGRGRGLAALREQRRGRLRGRWLHLCSRQPHGCRRGFAKMVRHHFHFAWN